ncbi:MAG TPA: AraC family transcriptional regulator [Candidatus Binatia bacterium]|nr:AraC family transcriptional regulator [Candidatus Binatia bacterium]
MRPLKIPRISVTAAAGLIEILDAARVDADALLRSAGLDRDALKNPDGYIPCAAFARLLEESARATKDECFGLHFGEHFNPKQLGALAYVVLHSPTFQTAVENSVRYLHLHNESVEVLNKVEGDRMYLQHVRPDFGLESVRQHNEYSTAITLNAFRLMAGSTYTPVEVQFAHEAPRDTSEHLRIFGCPVLFACGANAMVIEHAFMDRQVPAADPHLYPVVKRYLDNIMAAMPRESDFLCSVRKAIAECMRDGECKLAVVAKKLALSQRSLQRRLEEHGVDFNALVSGTRHRFAVEYLKNPGNTLSEVAFLLGYSEVSAFNRAFKRWTGTTPMQHRHKTRESRV